MDTIQFWRIIEDSRQVSKKNSASQREKLTNLLLRLSLEEILVFDAHYESFITKAYSHEMAGAAFVIYEEKGVEQLDVFLQAVVAEGEWAYELALENADSLHSWADASLMLTTKVRSAVDIAYRKKTGRDLIRAAPSLPTHFSAHPWISAHSWTESLLKTMLPELGDKFWPYPKEVLDKMIARIDSAFVNIDKRTKSQIVWDLVDFYINEDVFVQEPKEKYNKKRDWRDLTEDEILKVQDVLFGFGGLRWHFYLPAIMSYHLKNNCRYGSDMWKISGSLTYRDDSDFECFNQEQLYCVRDFLNYCRKCDRSDSNAKMILQQKAHLWP